jgi:hypothetical protein
MCRVQANRIKSLQSLLPLPTSLRISTTAASNPDRSELRLRGLENRHCRSTILNVNPNAFCTNKVEPYLKIFRKAPPEMPLDSWGGGRPYPGNLGDPHSPGNWGYAVTGSSTRNRGLARVWRLSGTGSSGLPPIVFDRPAVFATILSRKITPAEKVLREAPPIGSFQITRSA